MPDLVSVVSQLYLIAMARRTLKLENMLRYLLEEFGPDMRDEEIESIRRLLEKPKEEVPS